ncbi:hypothetical protein [Rubrivivax gelatinosus]|uniref:hypothetical protein n=1 Tax=Rubrivivax gelatinosus TaxID=28068 RepID=UPI0003008468|nr:hypothetical protein [Rubrivivax gelatinosus]MBG6083180.1 hypothetical protein [Rubrivivax gelatinosus]
MSKFTSVFIGSLPFLVVVGPFGAAVSYFLFGAGWVTGVAGGWAFALLLSAITDGATGADVAVSGDDEPMQLFDDRTDISMQHLKTNLFHQDSQD